MRLPNRKRMKSAGHERDLANTTSAADDLDYMHARFYNPQVGRFLRPDPVLGNARQPQSWNRYKYAMDSPLKYRDPTGLYIVNCPVDDNGQCKKSSEQFEQARQQDLKSKNPGVRNAALAYGDPGARNGITVAFGDTGSAGGTTKAYAKVNDNGSFSLQGLVTLQSGLKGTELRAAVAHEGQHLVDAANFVDSFITLTSAPWVKYDVSKNLTAFQTEVNAFRLTHYVYKAAGEKYSTGCRGCALGSGLKTAAEVDLAIKRILANPAGDYRLTPENQGPRELPDWQ